MGPATTAAAELLPPGAAATFAARFDADWHHAVGERWREAHEEMQPLLARLDRLDTEAVEGPLAPEHAVERAGLTEDLQGSERALPRWRDVLALEPGNARANMAVGADLLSEGDEAGLEHLERATASDPAAEPYAAQLAYAFEAARGRGEEAARHRSTVNAHLADDAPLYVLGLVPDTKWWRLEGGRDDQKMLERVVEEVALPGDFVAVSLASENKWLLKRLSKLGGAQVFAR